MEPCIRCGGARARFYVHETRYSGWSYAASLADFLLGRELEERERRHMLAGIVLN